VSYNVAICVPPVSSDDILAWDMLDALIDSSGDVPEVFREFYDRLTQRYPCICELSDGARGVWSDGPLWSNFGHRAAVLSIVDVRADEVVPFVVMKASSLGLTVFDWIGPTIYRPS
jgi:hypothetical protein